MDRAKTEWLVSSGLTSTGVPEHGYEWYGAKLAESAFTPETADTDLFDLSLYLRDKILDDQRYEPLARQAEVLLLGRMSGNGLAPHEVRGSTYFEPAHHRRAMDALCSGQLTHMGLIDLAELAHSERHEDKAGLKWQVIYDLARIQILRRIKRTPAFGLPKRPPAAHSDGDLPDRSHSGSGRSE